MPPSTNTTNDPIACILCGIGEADDELLRASCVACKIAHVSISSSTDKTNNSIAEGVISSTDTTFDKGACVHAGVTSLSANKDFNNLLQLDWFRLVLSPYLSFGDWRNLHKSNKVLKLLVSSLTATWPEEIRELNKTWCQGSGEALFTSSIAISRHPTIDCDVRHPAPMIQLHVDSLSYDADRGKLIGQPWSEVVVKNQEPKGLGRLGRHMCFANDAKTKIFFCGGKLVAPEGQANNTWIDLLSLFDEYTGRNSDHHEPLATGLFDLETGTWTELPSFPMRGEIDGIFRIGAKVYIVPDTRVNGALGEDPIFCIDLEHKRRERWLNGVVFPGEAQNDYNLTVVNDTTVIVSGGWYYSRHLGPTTRNASREVHSLDMTSGIWTRLPDLPEDPFGGSFFGSHSCRLHDGTMLFMAKESWATLSLDGEWELNPNLKGKGVKYVKLSYNNTNKIFAGNTWIELPPYNDQNVHRLQINGMRIEWNCTVDFVVR